MEGCEMGQAGVGCWAGALTAWMGLLAIAVGLAVAWAAWRRWRARRQRMPRAEPDGGRRRGMLVSLALASCGIDKVYGAGPPGKPSDLPARADVLTHIDLHNTARAAQAAHFVSPMFGLPMRQGDMPRGQFPQFVLPDGSVCPATLWGISSWPDGSMKFCGAMLRVPAAIAANEVLRVQVRRDGGKPAASRRKLAELQAAGLRVELTGGSGLEGVWTAALSDGIRDGADVVRIGDGAAGAVWRIGCEFRDAAGRAHGQLYCWHYVAALQNADGELLGLRYLGRVAQPWTDVRAPAARHRDLSARLLAGESVVRALMGHVDSETPGGTIRLPHYASFFTAGRDGRWDYLQAGGSGAADGSVRVRLDPRYCVRSRLVPPYDLDVPLRPAGDVDYHPMGGGSVLRGMGTTGERADIGVFPEWNVRHLISQSASDERIARVNALSAAGWRLTMRKHATKQPVPCVDIRPSYAALGPAQTAWRGYLHLTGMVMPAPNESLWGEDTSHRPACTYWPYLFSGEPQYLDLMVEHGFAHVLEQHPGTNVYATTHPMTDVYVTAWGGGRVTRIGAAGTVYKGAGVLFNGGGGLRTPAWACRDIAQAAALCPDTAPDGAAVRDYLRDVLQSAHGALLDYARQMPPSFSKAGLFILNKGNDSPWMAGYLSYSICHQADVLGTREAAQAREYLSRSWRAFAAIADIGCLTAYRSNKWNGEQMAQRIEDVVALRQGKLLFSAATNRAEIVDDSGKQALAWEPSDGDVFAFGSPETGKVLPFADYTPNRRLYAVHCQGRSFQLAATPGGQALPVPADVTITAYMCRARKLGAALDVRAGPYHYPANIRGALAYHLACGDPVEDAKAAMDAIVKQQGTRFEDRPKYCIMGARD